MKLSSILMVAFLLAAISYNSVVGCTAKDTRIPVPTTTTTTTTKPPEETTQVNPRFKDYPFIVKEQPEVEHPLLQEEPKDSKKEEPEKEEPENGLKLVGGTEMIDIYLEMDDIQTDDDKMAVFISQKCIFRNGVSWCLNGGYCEYRHSSIGCRCPSKYLGERCEYEIDMDRYKFKF